MRYFLNGKEITPAEAMKALGTDNFYKKVKNAYEGFAMDLMCVCFDWPEEFFRIERR